MFQVHPVFRKKTTVSCIYLFSKVLMVISLLCSSIHIRFKTRTVLFRVKSPGHLTIECVPHLLLVSFLFVCQILWPMQFSYWRLIMARWKWKALNLMGVFNLLVLELNKWNDSLPGGFRPPFIVWSNISWWLKDP